MELQSNMSFTCKICNSPLSHAFNAIVLGKHEAVYNYCEGCGFLCAANPHWLEEAYSSAIASTDTGLVSRNIAIANKLAAIFYLLMEERGQGRYVDLAGGYGVLTRLMRDYGFNFYWSDKYCTNLMVRGFEYTPEMGSCHAATAFEVLEHTEDPLKFLEDAFKYAQTDTLIFTTELYADKPPSPDQWWYYSFETGQHVSFYQRRTLAVLATKMGLHFSSTGCIHVLSKKIINQTLLKACTGRLGILATRWLRRNTTLIMSDHQALVDQLKMNNY